MTDNARFAKMLEPGQIGKVRTRNRMIKVCGGAEDMSEINLAFHDALARGGVGLIIWGDVAVDFPLGRTLPFTHRHLEEDKYIPPFIELAQVIHKHNCPVFMQLFHAGPQARLRGGLQTVSASALTESEAKALGASMIPKELTIPEIHDLVDKFARTAERAHTAGFDGVEVNGARMHLINSFLSRAWNKRQDEYGYASLENRARFMCEIVREIKRRLGSDFPVTTLINGVELGAEKGTTIEEAQGIARILQDAGSDAIHVRAFGYRGWGQIGQSEQMYYSEALKPLPKGLDWSHKGAGALVPLAAAVKKVVSVPIVAVGRLDPVLGEKVLEEGKADFIAMCRRLLADPEMPNKIASGRLEDIAPCTGCGDCSRMLALGIIREPVFVPIKCRINAALGGPEEHVIQPAAKKKKVVVVGGGPAGMEAARVAAIRGHEVTLYEKESRLGGLLPYVALVKGLDVDNDVTVLVRYLKTQISKLGVKTITGKELNASLIEEIKPDVVILATGGVNNIPEIPGIKGRNVVSSDDLNRRLKTYLRFFGPKFMRRLANYWMPVGKKVVIIGGTVEGCGLAEFFIKLGKQVTIVDTDKILGGEPLMRFRSQKRPTMIAEVKYEEITDKGITITTREGKKQTIEADTIVPALVPRPDTELLKALQGKVPEVYLAGGDGKEPSFIMNAIGSAYHVAKAI